MSNIKIIVNLPLSVAQAMKDMAQKNNISMTEVLRRAICREKFFRDAEERNEKIILQDKKNHMKEITFSY